MKTGIHPEYKEARIVCACGHVIETRSTRGDYRVEICSACHPFFTGKQKLVDTEGRVDRFRRRSEAADKHKAALAAKKKRYPRTRGGGVRVVRGGRTSRFCIAYSRPSRGAPNPCWSTSKRRRPSTRN